MTNAVREGIRARGGRRGPPVGSRPRLGVLDLALTALVVVATLTRTPTGGLLGYGFERLRGNEAELPTLTAWFESGAAAPPTAALAALPAPPPSVPDALPEPWRTAAHSVLVEGVPDTLAAALRAGQRPVDAEMALAEIDQHWRESNDASLALERAALGVEAVERAIGRARAAGEDDPEAFEHHRRFLSDAAAREADRFVGSTLALATALDLQWPLLVEHRVSSPYGERVHPTLKTKRFHDGIDLAVPVGTEVHAAQSGELVVVGEGGAAGRYVVMDHGFGVRTTYCHLSELPLERGAIVERGTVVGLSGNTGRSTGPHLHFAVRIAGKTVDPARFRAR